MKIQNIHNIHISLFDFIIWFVKFVLASLISQGCNFNFGTTFLTVYIVVEVLVMAKYLLSGDAFEEIIMSLICRILMIAIILLLTLLAVKIFQSSFLLAFLYISFGNSLTPTLININKVTSE